MLVKYKDKKDNFEVQIKKMRAESADKNKNTKVQSQLKKKNILSADPVRPRVKPKTESDNHFIRDSYIN